MHRIEFENPPCIVRGSGSATLGCSSFGQFDQDWCCHLEACSSFATAAGGPAIHEAIADKRGLLTEVCRRYGVARLEMFGSAARGTDFDPRTNAADSLGRFNPDTGLVPFDQILKLAEALSHILGRPVDLVQSAAVRNLYLRDTIERMSPSMPHPARVAHLAQLPSAGASEGVK